MEQAPGLLAHPLKNYQLNQIKPDLPQLLIVVFAHHLLGIEPTAHNNREVFALHNCDRYCFCCQQNKKYKTRVEEFICSE